jgi:hypothetical protein
MEIARSMAQAYPSVPVATQQELAQARATWIQYAQAWGALELEQKQEFVYFVLAIYAGEEDAAQALGLNAGGGRKWLRRRRHLWRVQAHQSKLRGLGLLGVGGLRGLHVRGRVRLRGLQPDDQKLRLQPMTPPARRPGALRRIVSGGQTGVDRAALDAALAADFPCGGWCPRGRKAEDGPIPARYPLRETSSDVTIERTRRNAEESDATLILTLGRTDRGTRATARHLDVIGKPHLAIDPGREPDPARVMRWLVEGGVGTLNLAGPRESRAPGIQAAARAYLDRLLAATI